MSDEVSRIETKSVPHRPRGSLGARPIAIGVAIVALLLGVLWFESTKAGAPSGRPPLPEVTVSEPLRRDTEARLEFLGQLSPVDQVELRAQVGGTLSAIHFRDGAVVRKGQLLFSIDPSPFEIKLSEAQATLQSASARLALSDRELARAQALKAGEAGTTQNVEQRTAEQRAAQASVEDARAQVRDARFDLDHARIVAPFTGRIGNHLVSVGALVAGSRAASSPTTLLATLVSLDPVHIDFDMSEADFAVFSRFRALKGGVLGDKVQIDSNGDGTFARNGVLDFVDNEINRSSGTIRARATVANPNLDLTPGQFAKVQMAVTRPAPASMIPDDAVIPDQSRHVVLTVADDGTVVSKPVELGDLKGGLRVIRSGLSANDRVIIAGLQRATAGSKVSTKRGVITAAGKSE